MKALTVWQPWAQLLAEGKKHEETRNPEEYEQVNVARNKEEAGNEQK